MPSHTKTWSFGSEGKKYSDEGNGGIPLLQNPNVVRIHGFKETPFGVVGVASVVLDLVKDESKVIDGQFRAKLQKDVDCINRAMIIGTQHTSTSGHSKQKVFLIDGFEVVEFDKMVEMHLCTREIFL